MSLSLGAAIYIALKPIFKIYTIMLVGYLVAKFDIVSMENAKGISNMVVNAILPCLTFNKIVSNISWRDIKEIGVIILSAFILFVLGATGALFTTFATTVPKNSSGGSYLRVSFQIYQIYLLPIFRAWVTAPFLLLKKLIKVLLIPAFFYLFKVS